MKKMLLLLCLIAPSLVLPIVDRAGKTSYSLKNRTHFGSGGLRKELRRGVGNHFDPQLSGEEEITPLRRRQKFERAASRLKRRNARKFDDLLSEISVDNRGSKVYRELHEACDALNGSVEETDSGVDSWLKEANKKLAHLKDNHQRLVASQGSVADIKQSEYNQRELRWGIHVFNTALAQGENPFDAFRKHRVKFQIARTECSRVVVPEEEFMIYYKDFDLDYDSDEDS